jgi:hypothetical protein
MEYEDATYYQCLRSIELARLGHLYATGKLTPADAASIMYDCQIIAGQYPIESLTVEAVIDDAGYRWSNSAEEIELLAERACARVYDKWDSGGHERSAAQDWACDLIEEYAVQEGVVLVEGEREFVE